MRHRGSLGPDGEPLVDGHPWDSPEAAAIVREAAGDDALLVRAEDSERFDILPLLVLTDGAIEAFGEDYRRLRPNLVISGVPGLAEREWEGHALRVGGALVGLADLRGRCIITTWDPATGEQDVDVLRRIRREFAGTMALNAWVIEPGPIAVGDPVELVGPLTREQVVDLPLGRFVAA